MLRVALSEEKSLDDDEASMMMIIDETMMSVDDTKMLTDDVDETLMMDDDETKKVGAEIRTRYYPNVVAQPCKRTRHGAAASLLQIQDKLPMQAKSIISAFLGMNQDSEFEPPEAKDYEVQSGELIEMLKKLLDEFRTKLS